MTFFYAVLIFLAGFLSPEPTDHTRQPRVVTHIQLEEATPSGTRLLTYDRPEEMEKLLTYLRMLQRQDPVGIDPDSFRSGHFRILLNMSDGTFSLYRQLHREYIKKNSGPWYPMTPGEGLQFPPE